jgi:hypothetical protein
LAVAVGAVMRGGGCAGSAKLNFSINTCKSLAGCV